MRVSRAALATRDGDVSGCFCSCSFGERGWVYLSVGWVARRAVAVSATWASSSSRRFVRSCRVVGVTIGSVEDDTMRWRCRVRFWISLRRWATGRTSEARRKIVRL